MVPAINGENTEKKLQVYSSYISPPGCSVLIALNLKGLDYEYKSLVLPKLDQLRPEFLKINPIGHVPALIDGDMTLGETFAILLYLEEKYPNNPLLPHDLKKKAINYQVANIVSSSIQPFIRLRVHLFFMGDNVGLNEKIVWIEEHLTKGFTALEKLLNNHAGRYATGDEIFLADLFLAPYLIGYPSVYKFDMSEFLLLCKLREEYMKVPAIGKSIPENQPDFPRSA